LIGTLPSVAGLFVVSGFSGHGFKLAPSVGEGVAQLVCGEPLSAFDREFFDPLRFVGRQGEIWGGAFGL
jgi:sarcosine oxidase subunit beta